MTTPPQWKIELVDDTTGHEQRIGLRDFDLSVPRRWRLELQREGVPFLVFYADRFTFTGDAPANMKDFDWFLSEAMSPRWLCEECHSPWIDGKEQCQRCGNRTREKVMA